LLNGRSTPSRQSQSSTDAPRLTEHGLRFIFLLLSLGLAGVQAYTSRFEMGADGISYLDIGAAFVRGDWSHAINGYWGIVYAWFLGIAIWATKATALDQFVVAHYLNFLIYAAVLFIFDHFWSPILDCIAIDENTRLLRTGVLYLGHAMFAYTFLPLIEVVSPDLLLAGVILGTGSLLWRYATSQNGALLIGVGLLIGCGYLIKSIMLPVGIVTLAVALIVQLSQRRDTKPVVGAILAMILVSFPLLLLLSKRAGHITIGDSGRLNYAWFVTQGPRSLDGRPLFQVGESVLTNPLIYQIRTERNVTYFPWFDPAAIDKDAHARIEPRRQLAVLVGNLKVYLKLFLKGYVLAAMPVVIFLFLNFPLVRSIRITNFLTVIAFACSALCAYAVILVEARYVVAFGCVLLGVAFGLSLRALPRSQFYLAGWVVTVSAVLFSLFAVFWSIRVFEKREADRTINTQQAEIASVLTRHGLSVGDGVFVVGKDPGYWIKLSGSSVAGIVPSTHAATFCSLAPEPSHETLELVRRTGARWIVTSDSTVGCSIDWWELIPNSPYRFHRL
jgi:hypothetical protein